MTSRPGTGQSITFFYSVLSPSWPEDCILSSRGQDCMQRPFILARTTSSLSIGQVHCYRQENILSPSLSEEDILTSLLKIERQKVSLLDWTASNPLSERTASRCWSVIFYSLRIGKECWFFMFLHTVNGCCSCVIHISFSCWPMV